MIVQRDEADRPVRWTVGGLLAWTEAAFERCGLPAARLDAEILLAHALSGTRLDLYTGYHKLVEPAERARFRELVVRRTRREPVAYLTGHREFYSISFSVTPAVLVPRPETEHIVDCALEELRGIPEQEAADDPRVLDLGTGCGNIAIAIASNHGSCRVDAVDVSAEALDVARGNIAAKRLEQRIRLFHGDWFGALPPGSGPYRVIVSNPPYVSRRQYERLMEDVRRYEPAGALLDSQDPDADGLAHYRRFASSAGPHLHPSGLLAVEVGAGMAGDAAAIFAAAGWRVERVLSDYGGVERVLALRPPEIPPQQGRGFS